MFNNIITCLIVGYLFGCISTSYLVGKMYNIDIREHGSGNAGTTNTMRVLGKQAGILVYLGDCIKCALAIFIMVLFYSKTGTIFNDQLIKLITGFGVVLGHNFPFWLKFKGGKGIAVTSAVILIFCLPKYWICPVIALIAFVAIIQYTGYVSLGSLTVVTIFLLYIAVRFVGEPGYEDVYLYMLLFAFLFAASAYYMHRANIVRLINGTENKMGQKKNTNDLVDNNSDNRNENVNTNINIESKINVSTKVNNEYNTSNSYYQDKENREDNYNREESFERADSFNDYSNNKLSDDYETAQYLKKTFNSDSDNLNNF